MTEYEKSIRFVRTWDKKVFNITTYGHWSTIRAEDDETDTVKFFGISAAGDVYVSASKGYTYEKTKA